LLLCQAEPATKGKGAATTLLAICAKQRNTILAKLDEETIAVAVGAAGRGRRIAPLNIGGERVWLKDFNAPSPPKWHRLQQGLFLVTRLQTLRPVPSGEGLAGAEHEVETIARLRAAGVHVPEVLWVREARIVISDIGRTVRDLEKLGGEPAITSAVLATAGALSRIHAHDLVHGRPILRNMTWNGDIVGFLDFEERPLEVMPLEAAKARDVLLFLMSLGRRNSARLTAAAFDAYAVAMATGVLTELRRIAVAFGPLSGLLGRTALRSGNRNVIGLVRALNAIADHL
jgi:tRNA A-37 threonylcarbamoyl transferase component Bud32